MHRLAAAFVLSQIVAGTPAAAQGIEYEDYHLTNGLRVILVQDHSVPVVTTDIWYDVGSANERTGRSGFAHLFEHLMFQGSAHVAKAEHMQLVERAGGAVNASTANDVTNYFQTLPANRLNLALWLEADRMRSLAVTEENFENQRKAVQEERRLRVDNQPYTAALLDGLTLPFDSASCFPYSHTVIGSMDDLNAAPVQDVQAFFDLYYAPNNATLTLVGDFEPAHARQLISEYFDDIPRKADPPPVPCDWQPGTERREVVWTDAHANLPGVFRTYLIPTHAHEDARALQLLSIILGSGESSRLNRALVRGTRAAVQAGAQIQSQRMAGIFLTLAIANQGVATDTLSSQLFAEVARIIDEGVTEEELTKAKNSFISNEVFGRQTTMSLAERVQHYVHDHPSLDEINTDMAQYGTVTREDVRRVARQYLQPENSLTIVVVPGTQEAPVP